MTDIHYSIPKGIVKQSINNRISITTPQGGKVVTDQTLLSLWEFADGRSISEIATEFHTIPAASKQIRAGLACLSEAGLLSRNIQKKAKKQQKTSGELVSIVLVGFNSKNWLPECLPSIYAQTYSPIETILVDNGSTDNTASWIKEHYPEIVFYRYEQSHSLAYAINKGTTLAKGKYFLFLNPDIKLEPNAIAEAVERIQSAENTAAAGLKLKLWWAPSFLNGLGNRVGAFSWGTDNGLGHLDLGQFDDWEELPSACFAAALIDKNIWGIVGKVDEKFPMYYEDTEWCYRARALGYKILAAPKAVAYHAFGGRFPTGNDESLSPHKLQNVIYGRYRFALKLLNHYKGRFIRNYFIEDWGNFTRLLFSGKLHSCRSYLNGWIKTIQSLPELHKENEAFTKKRKLDDKKLFSIQKDMPIPFIWHGLPELTWDLIQNHYLPLFISNRTKPMPEFTDYKPRPSLLIISHDVIGKKLAGPGMRFLEMARALSKDIDVTLAVPTDTDIAMPDVKIVRYWENRPNSLQVLVENNDIALISGYMVEKFPFIQNTKTRLVVDYYDPFVLENLHYYFDEPIENQVNLTHHAIHITNILARIGDFFICGNERQRDYWMGVLTSNARTNPQNFIHDPSLRSLIDVVSIGFPGREPHHYPLIRGINPQVPKDAKIVLWGGGIWNWLDPLTLIKAWKKVLEHYPNARLIFLGTRHPNPDVPHHEMVDKAEALAESIGEKDKTILFFEWLSYEDREALLCEADVGVTLHPVHVETRYSMRTRVLDYFWAKLPTLMTEGDITSEWIKEYNLGVVVPEFDEEAVSAGLIQLLDKPKDFWKENFNPLWEELQWERVVEPLRKYCLEGGYAPDRQNRVSSNHTQSNTQSSLFARARFIWRTEGTTALIHRTGRYIQHRLAN